MTKAAARVPLSVRADRATGRARSPRSPHKDPGRWGPAGARGPRRLIAQSSCRPGRGRAGGPGGCGRAHNEVCKKLICSATRSSPQSKAGVGRGQRGGYPGWHPEAGCGDPGFPRSDEVEVCKPALLPSTAAAACKESPGSPLALTLATKVAFRCVRLAPRSLLQVVEHFPGLVPFLDKVRR